MFQIMGQLPINLLMVLWICWQREHRILLDISIKMGIFIFIVSCQCDEEQQFLWYFICYRAFYICICFLILVMCVHNTLLFNVLLYCLHYSSDYYKNRKLDIWLLRGFTIILKVLHLYSFSILPLCIQHMYGLKVQFN